MSCTSKLGPQPPSPSFDNLFSRVHPQNAFRPPPAKALGPAGPTQEPRRPRGPAPDEAPDIRRISRRGTRRLQGQAGPMEVRIVVGAHAWRSRQSNSRES
eukprot:4238226-Pyramimonas_sp.AAC.1